MLFLTGIFSFANCTGGNSTEKDAKHPVVDSHILVKSQYGDDGAEQFPRRDAFVTFTSTNNRIDKNEQAPSRPKLINEIAAWRGEKVHFQVLVWAKSNIKKLSIVCSDFRNDTNNKIAGKLLNYGFSEFITANLSGGHCGLVNKNLPKFEVSDPISPQLSKDISADVPQSIWATIEIPTDTKPGKYHASISFLSNAKKNLDTLSLIIDVNKRVLPPPSQWSFHLDLWQYPLREAAYYNVKPWSDEHFKLLKPSMLQLANAGQKAITASFFWDVFSMENMKWGEENLMIRIEKGPDGSNSYNFTNFDKWVEFMLGLGIKDQINCFGIYPTNSNYEYHYRSPANNKVTKKTMQLLSNDYQSFWAGLLKAFSQHLKAKGWMEKAVLYIDERPANETRKVIDMVKKIDPSFKIGYTGAYHAQIENDLYDFSIASYLSIPTPIQAKRLANKQITTFYTCCYEKQPNTFTYSSPAESTFMGWYAAANGYQGYLRWAYDLWEKNALTDTRSSYIPAGDGFLSYPRNYKCLRFEKLREGIQDFEKIRLLKKEFTVAHNQNALIKLTDVLQKFKKSKVKGISNYSELIDNARSVINSF